MRKRLYKLYWKLERIIHPALRYSQYHYCDALDALVPAQSDWLDLGCGHQMFAPWMTEEAARLAVRAHHLVGIDMDLPALKINPVMHDTVFGDVSSLPFTATAFDVVTANMVVEHLDKPKAVLEEVHRILRPGGLFIFHTPNRKSVAMILVRMMPQFLKNWLALVLEQREEKDVFPTHYAMNTRETVTEFARSAGFQVREIRAVSTSAITALTPFCVIELLYLRLLERPGLAGMRSNLIVALEKP